MSIINFKRIGTRLHRSRYLYLLILLPVIYYLLFHYRPMYGILIAFQNFRVARGIWGSDWVGLLHFRRFLGDPYFWQLVRNTFLISFYGLLWGFPAPIILAIMLNELRLKRFKRFVQSVSYLPHFISVVVISGMVVRFVSFDGLINQITGLFGIAPRQFLMFPQYFRTIFISSGIWSSVGWGSIIYLAALSGVNPELYEAASIDGAGRFRKMISVTLPSITPTISIMLVLNLGRILSVGHERVLLLYNGAIFETADVISTFVFRRGIMGNDFSFATAIGLFESLIGLVFIITANKISNLISENGLW
ncbi:MAG: ABC transporter permease subunit [Defluviitaleaceae bacterium]|nr:ABC transporter permease subunit [Defluviitaleaceae bacterium]